MWKLGVTSGLLLLSAGCFQANDDGVLFLCESDGVSCPPGQVCVDAAVCADEALITPDVDPVVAVTPFANALVTGKTLRGAVVTVSVNGQAVATAVAEPDFDPLQTVGDFAVLVPLLDGANQLTVEADLGGLVGASADDAAGAPLAVELDPLAPLFAEEAAARGLDFPVPARGNSRDEGANNGATFQDLDNDGDLDLVIGSDPDNVIRLNNGQGSFSAGAALINDVAASFADIDEDGDLDAGLSSSGANGKLFRNDLVGGQASFAQIGDFVDAFNSEGILFVDTDGGGQVDLLFQDSGENRLFLGAGNFVTEDRDFFQSFQDATGESSDASFVANCYLDGDDLLDVIISDAPNHQVFLGVLGAPAAPVAGNFFNAGNLAGRGLLCADLDNDGAPEIVAAEGGNGLRVVALVNQAPQQLDLLPVVADGVAAGDLDNDGDLDLLISSDDADSLLLNLGGIQGGQAGEFLDASALVLAAGGNGEGVALGDVNGDGNLDGFVIDQNQPSRLYLGALGAVQARRVRVAREVGANLVDVVGARVLVQVNTANGPQPIGLRVVDGGSGHGGQESLVLHFGGVGPRRTVQATVTVPGCAPVEALLPAGQELFSFAGDCP